MTCLKSSIVALTFVCAFMAITPSQADADGPLRRWFRGLRNPKTCSTCSTCPTGNRLTTGFAPTQAANNAFNLQPGQCMKTCQQTCSRTVVNYVPYTAYRTAYKQVPVTTYKPQTTSDPCTGCTVTCMRPCTTYTYQCQQVPYTTYRPVYRQETYKVPVTTITNGCATGTCATGTCNTGCNTCATGGFVQQSQQFAPTPAVGQPTGGQSLGSGTVVPQANITPTITNFAPNQNFSTAPAPSTTTYYEEVPNGTINPSGASYGTTPADQMPSLLDGINPTTTQRPFLDRFNQTSSVASQSRSNTPATINVQERTAMSPVRKQWGYSPVRTASYSSPNTTRAQRAPLQNRLKPMSQSGYQKSSNSLNGWKEVN